MSKQLCTICQRRPIHARGRCNRCYQWRRRHGQERPREMDDPPPPCADCGKTPTVARGLCCTCYSRHQQRGEFGDGITVICESCDTKKRHKARGLCHACYNRHWYRTRRHHNPLCRRCRRDAAITHGMCRPCRVYEQRNGRPRPSHRWAEHCLRCKKPDVFCRGLCHTCYFYQLRTGRDRPRRLIERQAPHGWCDCGEPAIETRAVTVSQRATVELKLCYQCLEWEEEMSA